MKISNLGLILVVVTVIGLTGRDSLAETNCERAGGTDIMGPMVPINPILLFLAPNCRDKKASMRSEPVGFLCRSGSDHVFIRSEPEPASPQYHTPGLPPRSETWLDFDTGTFWLAPREKATHDEAARRCAAKYMKLPSPGELMAGREAGIQEVLPLWNVGQVWTETVTSFPVGNRNDTVNMHTGDVQWMNPVAKLPFFCVSVGR